MARSNIANRLKLSDLQVDPILPDLEELAVSEPVQETSATTALDNLVKYIPTESVTLYVAGVAAKVPLASATGFITPSWLYWSFAIFTPILFLLIYAGKRRGNGLPPFPPLREWPWWKLLASTIAFLTWALAVPEGPYLQGENEGAVAALAALFISTLLSILAAVIEKPAP